MEPRLWEISSRDIHCIYTKEDRQRVISIFNLLAAESTDPRDSILGKLKEVLPTMPLNVIKRSDFPYSCLKTLFTGKCNFSGIISDKCNFLFVRLCKTNGFIFL